MDVAIVASGRLMCFGRAESWKERLCCCCCCWVVGWSEEDDVSGQKRRNIGGDVVYICTAIGHCGCYSRPDCSGRACCVPCRSLAFVTDAETVARIQGMSEIDASPDGSIELDCPGCKRRAST